MSLRVIWKKIWTRFNTTSSGRSLHWPIKYCTCKCSFLVDYQYTKHFPINAIPCVGIIVAWLPIQTHYSCTTQPKEKQNRMWWCVWCSWRNVSSASPTGFLGLDLDCLSVACFPDRLFRSILQLSGHWGHCQEMSLYILYAVDPIQIHNAAIPVVDGDQFEVSEP